MDGLDKPRARARGWEEQERAPGEMWGWGERRSEEGFQASRRTADKENHAWTADKGGGGMCKRTDYR